LGSFEDDYHQNFLRALTKEEGLELKELHWQLDARFGEVVAFIAHELRCSEAQAHEEAKQAIEEWDVAPTKSKLPQKITWRIFWLNTSRSRSAFSTFGVTL
jgi:hypothetical protein